jgi:hypothetical protein
MMMVKLDRNDSNIPTVKVGARPNDPDQTDRTEAISFAELPEWM